MIWPVCLAAVLTLALPALALDQDDRHWCRNGLFPSEPHITAMRVIGAPRVYLREDGGSAAGCPALDSCRAGYVLPGQEVLAGQTMGSYVCAYFPKSSSAGWVRTSELAPDNPLPTPTLHDWTGHWAVGEDEDKAIDIIIVAGSLAVEGEAYWPSRREVERYPQHSGSFSASARPSENQLELTDAICKISLRLVGRNLVAADNSSCGGANVRFDDVYSRVPHSE